MNRSRFLTRGWSCPTATEMRAIDRDTIEREGIPAELLMETAGREVAEAIVSRFPECRRPLIVCGPGNNGGDGFVIARVLREWTSRCVPTVACFGDSARLSPEARSNLDRLRPLGLSILNRPDEKELAQRAADCDLVVDALFGVGLKRAIEAEYADTIRVLESARRPVVAVDVPSGISSDTGLPLGPWLPADLIVTLGLPKLGLALRASDSEILVVDIGLADASLQRVAPRQHVLTPSAAAALLPERPLDGHKGSFGHVLVVGGSAGKTGAVALASEGALRSGAGLVTAAVPRSLHPILEVKLTEAMTLGLDDLGDGRLAGAAGEQIGNELQNRDALVLGPGLGQAPETARAVCEVLARTSVPAVVDADALNVFESNPEALCGPGPRVLTPHPGEAARLLSRSTADVQGDRVAAARELAALSRAIVVLKGARSLIATPEGEIWVNPTGGPGLAAGGSGDVLAGVIAALLGQGLSSLDAARLGVYLHGSAGDAGPRVGGLASEVATRIPQVWEALLAGDPGEQEPELARRPHRFS